MRTGLILTAAATYVAILGCVIFPTQTTGKAPNGIGGGGGPFRSVTTNQPLTGLPYKGVAIQIQRVDWIDEYKKSIDEVAAVRAHADGPGDVGVRGDWRTGDGEQEGGLDEGRRIHGARIVPRPPKTVQRAAVLLGGAAL